MKKFTVCLFGILLFLSAWAGEQWQLTILHTNDLHGYMMPFDYQATNEQFMKSEGFIDSAFALTNAGGLARRASLIADYRKQAKHTLVVVDTGDVFTRGPWHKQFYGKPEIEVYNKIRYDLACIGNNEFKATGDVDSQQILIGLVKQSKFPWLAANLTVGDTGNSVEGIKPYVIRKFGNVKVGFLGLTAPRSQSYPQTKGWTISDPIATAKKLVPMMRKECDIVIAVTHIGVDLDKLLALQVDGIDAIVGGDSHTFIPKPIMIGNPSGTQVPIVQDGAYGVYLGVFDLTFEKTDGWHLIQSEDKLVPIDSTIKEDPAVKKILDKWITPTEQKVAAGWLVPAVLYLSK